MSEHERTDVVIKTPDGKQFDRVARDGSMHIPRVGEQISLKDRRGSISDRPIPGSEAWYEVTAVKTHQGLKTGEHKRQYSEQSVVIETTEIEDNNNE